MHENSTSLRVLTAEVCTEAREVHGPAESARKRGQARALARLSPTFLMRSLPLWRVANRDEQRPSCNSSHDLRISESIEGAGRKLVGLR
jgi:hypothetical protein